MLKRRWTRFRSATALVSPVKTFGAKSVVRGNQPWLCGLRRKLKQAAAPAKSKILPANAVWVTSHGPPRTDWFRKESPSYERAQGSLVELTRSDVLLARCVSDSVGSA